MWSGNDAARARFGYAVDLEQLPLSRTVTRRAWFVVAWWDTFLDWDKAPDYSRWWSAEAKAFDAAAQELLELLRQGLGTEYDIVDESGSMK